MKCARYVQQDSSVAALASRGCRAPEAAHVAGEHHLAGRVFVGDGEAIFVDERRELGVVGPEDGEHSLLCPGRGRHQLAATYGQAQPGLRVQRTRSDEGGELAQGMPRERDGPDVVA